MGLLDDLLGAVAAQGTRNDTQGGGLGDLLSGLAGGRQGAGGGAGLMMTLLPVVVAMLANRGGPSAAGSAGGLDALLQQLGAAGLAQQADSWVGPGGNMPVSPEQLSRALGPDRVSEIAAQAGVTEDEASAGLASLLPELVNQLTPQGEMPPPQQVDDSLASLRRSLGI